MALRMQQESPVKRGILSEQDRRLQSRFLKQIDANMDDIHDIFFRKSMRERMFIIAQDRYALRERRFRWKVRHTCVTSCVQLSYVLMTYACVCFRLRKEEVRNESVPPQSSHVNGNRKQCQCEY